MTFLAIYGSFWWEVLQLQYFGLVRGWGTTNLSSWVGRRFHWLYLFCISELVQLWDAQIRRDLTKLHYIIKETTGMGNPLLFGGTRWWKLKSWGERETRLLFRCLKVGHVGEITLIHEVRAEARLEVLRRQIPAQCNSLCTSGVVLGLCQEVLTGYNT